MEDPHVILGVAPGASPEQVVAAYRALAKQLHPDLSGDGPQATARMAELNAARDALRPGGATAPGTATVAAERARRGEWVSDALRVALGHELLRTLEPGEQVALVTPATTWASPRAVLALSDRRLLWLLDDAVMHRVRWLRRRDVLVADYTLTWPRRRRATLRVRARDGHRHAFADLRPALAAQIALALQLPPAAQVTPGGEMARS